MKKMLIAVLTLLLTAMLLTTTATAQEKITGPWLWLIAPTEPGLGGAASIDIDSLAVASGGAVTEAAIAANGARAGDRVGNYVWTFGEISATGGDNINECLNRIGMTNGNVDDHSSYALFQFQADTAQRGVTMHVGSDDAIKVWLNGTVVHNHPVDRGASDFQDTFHVDSVAGENLLLVKVSERGGAWSMFVGMDTADAPVRVPVEVVSIPDANLAAAIRAALGLPTDAAITADAILDLTRLDAPEKRITDLTGLEHATNLTELNLYQNPVSDVSPLAALTQLTSLNLYRTGVSDVSLLANLTQLTTLNLSGTGVSDVSPLAALTQLTSLNLAITTAVSDVSPLANLTQLTSLNLAYTGVSDVSPLANLTQLTWLRLWHTGVSDVSPLANLAQLTGLGLHDTGVSDVSPLANLTQLTTLSLSETHVSDVSPLAALTQLTTLDLWDTGVSDVSPLANLTQLTWLTLDDTAVSDVSLLANLTQLTRLDLSGTGVSDVSPLAALTQLTTLGLHDTYVSDVSPLVNLTLLRGLGLYNTYVSDVSPLVNLTQLETLSLTGSPLSYTSIHIHIPVLQAKGISVYFNDIAHPALLKVSGDGQEGAPAATLKTPFVVEAMDAHGKPIVGIPVQFDILAGGGRLSAQTATTDAQGTARVTLTLGSSQGVNKVKASSEGIRSRVLFTAVATEEVPQLVADVNGDGIVNIQDLVLVAGQFGETGKNSADVNGDGVVNIQDLVLVAGALR